MIEERVAQLVEQETGQHVPRNLVAAPLAGDVAAVQLDDLRSPRGDTGNAGPQRHPVVPVANARHDQQAAGAAQRPRDQIAPGRILTAPRARRHPVVHPAVAVGADVLEIIVLPGLRAAAPGTKPHRVHDAAAASPLAATVELESLGRLERLVARILVLDVAATPGAERRCVRHDPTTVCALGVRLTLRVLPLESPAAARAKAPEPLQLGVAVRAAQLGRGDFARAHRAIASSTMR